MKRIRLKAVVIAIGSAIAATVAAQDPLRGVSVMGSGDLAAIKQKAEAGDAKAQVALADGLAFHFHPADAYQWYRKAAEQGNVEAAYQVGRFLLFGATGIPKDQNVQPNPTEGIRWTFRAATNNHANACQNMSRALQGGLGVRANQVEAYAWLQLFADSPGGSYVGRVELNQLVLKMDTSTIQQAQQLAAEFRSGHWRRPVMQAIPEGDSRLKLNGITVSATSSVAIINGKNFAEGESATIPTKPGTIRIKCLEIAKESVLITIEGEDQPRRLRLK